MKAKEGFLELGGYRLPTEAKWEYACRAGAETSRHYGQSESLLEHYAWYQSNRDRNWYRVTQKRKPNDFGLFDMQGNVWEWCYDAFGSYPLDENDEAADQPSSEEVLDAGRRVLRGGSFNNYARNARSANRNDNYPGNRYNTYGFRVARTYP
jgi:formylglycine-generating enzyme required for sulfatase activity